jgi:hypothetical protein
LNEGEVLDFIPEALKRNCRIVTSDTAITELIGGKDTEILKKYEFLYVYSHEPAFMNGKVSFYRDAPDSQNLIDTDPIEKFLRGLLRSVSGSSTVPDLNSLFGNGLADMIDAMKLDLPQDADPRLVRQLDAARAQFDRGLKGLPVFPTPIVTDAEMDALKLGPKNLGNIRPPGLVRKIRDIAPSDDDDWFGRLTAPFREDEDIKSRIQELCLLLVSAGFARDRGLGKDDETKSDAAAKSQFNDISHICSGAVCSAFVTADRRCAKLAFAVYEALSLNSRVIYLDRRSGNPLGLQLVGNNFWP